MAYLRRPPTGLVELYAFSRVDAEIFKKILTFSLKVPYHLDIRSTIVWSQQAAFLLCVSRPRPAGHLQLESRICIKLFGSTSSVASFPFSPTRCGLVERVRKVYNRAGPMICSRSRRMCIPELEYGKIKLK